MEASGDPATVLFGDDVAFTETYALAFPGVLAITTNGATMPNSLTA